MNTNVDRRIGIVVLPLKVLSGGNIGVRHICFLIVSFFTQVLSNLSISQLNCNGETSNEYFGIIPLPFSATLFHCIVFKVALKSPYLLRGYHSAIGIALSVVQYCSIVTFDAE